MRDPSYCGFNTQVVTVWYRAPEILLGSVWPWDSVSQVSFGGLGCACPLAMPRTSTASVWTCGLLAASLRRWQQVELFCDILIGQRVVRQFQSQRDMWCVNRTDVSSHKLLIFVPAFHISSIQHLQTKIYPGNQNPLESLSRRQQKDMYFTPQSHFDPYIHVAKGIPFLAEIPKLTPFSRQLGIGKGVRNKLGGSFEITWSGQSWGSKIGRKN